MPINGRRFLIVVIGVVIIGGAIYFFLSNLLPIETSKEIQQGEIFNPSLLSWEKVTTPIPWQPRDSHGVLVFKDKLWLIGGLNGNGFVEKPGVVRYSQAPHFSDIWCSEDGINWNLVTEKAPWGKRRSIQAVVFKNKIWLIPGWGPWTGTKNEVWNSEDGIHWNLINSNPNFPPREGHQLVVFQDKLWLIGGVNYEKRETKNDVWYSEDGLNWIEATSSAFWSARWDHGVVVFKDKLWLIGGMDLENNLFGDVWSSEDGKNWSLVSDRPLWPARQGHEVVVFKDRIWILGRFNQESQGKEKNDVWFSKDGINWQKTKKDPPWQGREDHRAVVFQNKIWILGGMTTDWVWKNDIWFSK
jgi:hypothetical protein